MGKEGEFKSFGDLLRSRGGGDSAPEKPEKKRGWTLESDDGLRDPDELGGPEHTARERIGARVDGYGPMEHGPPPYRDLDSDEMRLLASFRVRTVFPRTSWPTRRTCRTIHARRTTRAGSTCAAT